jgi:subtilisin family serine protease
MKKWFLFIFIIFVLSSFLSVESVYRKLDEESTVAYKPSTYEINFPDKELGNNLRDAGIEFSDQDLIDYANAEEIPLLIKYESPVTFGLKEEANKVSDLTSSAENVDNINKIKEVTLSVGGNFKGSHKTIPWSVITVPRDKVKEFKSTLSSNLGNKLKKVYVEPIYRLTLSNSVPLTSANLVWGLKNATGQYITGKDTTILILDSGINYTHPDLGGCFGSSCKVIGGYDYINFDTDPMDEYGHGTHVAAIAAGNGVLKGVAPDAKLIAYRVCDNKGECNLNGNLQNKPLDDMITRHPTLISMSLGGIGDNPDNSMICDAIKIAVSEGIVVVVAAGNNGPGSDTINDPGFCEEAITVGSVYKEDPKTGQIAPSSSRGPVVWTKTVEGVPQTFSLNKPDVVAPGVLVCSARTSIYQPWYSNLDYQKCVDDNHVLLSGTSMATPFVSGTVALMKQAHPDWGPCKIKSVLMNTSVNLGYDLYTQGYGLVDAMHALEVDSNCYGCP